MIKWKTIPGFEKYDVSKCGQVRNNVTGRILKPAYSGPGRKYFQVDLSMEGVRTKKRINRLVAEAFVHNKTGFDISMLEANHDDGDTFNNNSNNLTWMTPDQNKAHAMGMQKVRSKARSNIKYTRGNLRKVLIRKNGNRTEEGFFHRFTTGLRPKAIIEMESDGSITTVAATNVVFL